MVKYILIQINRIVGSMEVEAREIISHDQSRTIIELFFKLKFDLQEVVAQHRSKHNHDQIIAHIKKMFTKIVLEMEYQLLATQKIKNMQLTENSTPDMFDALLKLSDVLPEEQITDFMIYYRNKVSRVSTFQTDLICSERRQAIYATFVNYAIDKDLFKYALVIQKPIYNSRPGQMIENPTALFQPTVKFLVLSNRQV